MAIAKLKKQYEITYPNGEKEVVSNLKNWCRNNGLDNGNMYRVISGQREHHKNFKCKVII